MIDITNGGKKKFGPRRKRVSQYSSFSGFLIFTVLRKVYFVFGGQRSLQEILFAQQALIMGQTSSQEIFFWVNSHFLGY